MYAPTVCLIPNVGDTEAEDEVLVDVELVDTKELLEEVVECVVDVEDVVVLCRVEVVVVLCRVEVVEELDDDDEVVGSS